MNITKKELNYPLLAFFLVLFIGVVVLFVNPIIGMADNGDFYRIISANGVYHLNPNDPDIFNKYFIKDYGIYKYYNENTANFISTQGIFIKIAVFLSSLINKNYVLDIRYMSWIFLLVHAISIFLISKVLLSNISLKKYKVILILLLIFIFCDTAYLAYFNSFYGEAVEISFFLLSISILLYMIEFEKTNIISMCTFAAASFVFLGSKQQLAPLGILIALIFIKFAIDSKEKILNILSIAMAVFFIASSVFFYKSITGDFKYINNYHSMNRGMLLYEDNPEEVMKFFNINKQYTLLQETTFYDNITLTDLKSNEMIDNYYEKFTTPKIIEYYISHPDAFFKIIKFALNNGYSIRPNAMGNYEKSALKEPGAKCYYFSAYSYVKEKIFTQNIGFSIAFIVFCLYEFAIKIFKGVRQKDKKSININLVFIYVFLVGISQILVSAIGAGDADLAKHVFMYNMSFDIILIYFIYMFFQKRDIKIRKTKEMRGE